MNLGDGAHRRAWVVRSRFLLDGNRRRQTFDVIDIGLFHQRQKLPGVGGQRFDVAALALGIQGIEGQRGFAGTGQTGDDNQPVAGQVEIDVVQVVRAGAANLDHVHAREVGKGCGLKGHHNGTLGPYRIAPSALRRAHSRTLWRPLKRLISQPRRMRLHCMPQHIGRHSCYHAFAHCHRRSPP